MYGNDPNESPAPVDTLDVTTTWEATAAYDLDTSSVALDADDPNGSAPPAVAVPPAPAPAGQLLTLPKRTVSGRYSGSLASFRLDLRVDVDGSGSVNRVSGDYYVASGSSSTYFGSWIIDAPAVNVTPTNVTVTGTAHTTWTTTYNQAVVRIPRVTVFQPPAAATLTWSTSGGATGAVYTCSWVSRYYRTIEWEQDSVVGAIPFVSYDTASLPAPAGSPTGVLTVARAFAEARLEMLVAGAANVVAATTAKWDESQLHAAMVNNFSLWADVPQWKVYTLVATSFVQDGVRGIMFDAADAHQRQGMAVFYDAIGGASAAVQRAQLRTYVHELGHCFNLLHSWDKGFADPPQPLGPNGGLGDLSWMNYTWKYQPPPPAAGGDAAYWAAFPFRFTANELVHLRHGLRNDVIMGGSDFGRGAAEIDPLIFADRDQSGANLTLDLRARPTYALGEPVVVELKLAGTDRRGVRTHGRIHPRDGLVQIAVQRPSGATVLYRPLMPRCVEHGSQIVLDDDQPATYTSAYIGYGQGGFTFEQPGTYQLRAIYVADDGTRVLSPTVRLRVRSPITAADDSVADLLLAEGQGELLYLLGSDAPELGAANAAMDELLDRHGKHPLAVYARLAKGVNAERDFKRVTASKELQVRPAEPAEAIGHLSAVAEASTGDRGVDNITLNMVMRTLAAAESKAGEVEQSAGTLDRMVEVFKRKGLKPHVLRTIAAEADVAKATLAAERDG